MQFTDVLDGFVPDADGYRVRVGADWRQGRAIYGGLSAALCIRAGMRMSADLPPLRAAQFVFLGPASDTLRVTPAVLRRGKSTAFQGVDITGDDGFVTRGLLCFGAGRPSKIDHRGVAAPAVPPPESCPDFFEDRPKPVFSQHFDMRRAGGELPFTASGTPEMLIWIRHRDTRAHPADPACLIGMADAAPPAAITMFAAPAPISSVTWSLDVMESAPSAAPGAWFLLQTTGLAAARGYATQAMYLWDSAGAPLVISTQCVALFG